MTASEHESLLNSLHREHDLRRRVKEMIRFRNNGITRFDDCIQFNRLTLARQNHNSSVSGFNLCMVIGYVFLPRRRRKGEHFLLGLGLSKDP